MPQQVLEGLFTIVVAGFAAGWLPRHPTHTTSTLWWRRSWFTELEEKIVVNRVLRDDPAKGLLKSQIRITFQDIKESFRDPSFWLVFLIGIVACRSVRTNDPYSRACLIPRLTSNSPIARPGVHDIFDQTNGILHLRSQYAYGTRTGFANHLDGVSFVLECPF